MITVDNKRTKAKHRLNRSWFVMLDSDYQLFSDSVLHELMMTHEKETDASGRAEQWLKELKADMEISEQNERAIHQFMEPSRLRENTNPA